MIMIIVMARKFQFKNEKMNSSISSPLTVISDIFKLSNGGSDKFAAAVDTHFCALDRHSIPLIMPGMNFDGIPDKSLVRMRGMVSSSTGVSLSLSHTHVMLLYRSKTFPTPSSTLESPGSLVARFTLQSTPTASTPPSPSRP